MKKIMMIILILCVWLLLVGWYQTQKEMPQNTNFRGEERSIPVENIEFLHDLTYLNPGGEIIHQQTIFDEMFSLIGNAREYILCDAFLFNPYTRQPEKIYRNLSAELTESLIQKKKDVPAIQIDFITDPINTVYGGDNSEQIEKLTSAGVNVIVTDLRQLPDSNPIYSAIWRTFIQWFGNSRKSGLVPHPFTGGGRKVTLRSYFDMINFKANHRKIFMADQGDTAALIITSGNPHDGSAAHSNVALKIKGKLWRDVYEAESAVARFSGSELQQPSLELTGSKGTEGEQAKIVLLTENRIKSEILSLIEKTAAADEIRMALFYLADRHIIRELLSASQRGVHIEIILDPNKDAFGFEKNGIPNRPVAAELVKKSEGRIGVRWYDTHGEQFHTKMAMIKRGREVTLLLGSANFTRRNLNNFNLEANVSVTCGQEAPFMVQAEDYFERIWTNPEGKKYTVGYQAYQDDSALKRFIYLVQEYAGLSSF